MKNELVLYTNPMSRGRIARWMLEEVGATYRTEILEYGEQMKSKEYLALNPMGKVPTLRHGNRIVTECAAICAYLADAFPEAGLAPEPKERADYYRWLFFAAGPLESAITDRNLGVQIAQEKERTVGYGNYDRAVGTLVQAIERNPFIAGSQFSAADVYVGSHVGWGLQFGTLPKSPTLQNYWERLSGREALARANEIDGAPPKS